MASSDAIAPLVFRPLCVDDLGELQALHEELFPVRYTMAFFEAAVRGFLVGTNEPLITLVATTENSASTPRSAVSQASPMEEACPPPSTGCAASPFQPNPVVPQPTPRESVIAGFVIAQLTPTDTSGDADLVWPPKAYPQVMYILTLGIRPAFRRRGLGKALLKRCIAQAKDPTCGAVYLHVITYNYAAIRFYEANGFRRLRLLPEYYLIDAHRYDAYVYILYLHGAMDPNTVSWLTGVLRPIVLLARSVAAWLQLKGRQPCLASEEEQDDDEVWRRV